MSPVSSQIPSLTISTTQATAAAMARVDLMKLPEVIKRIGFLMPTAVARAMLNALSFIGNTAATKFMIPEGGEFTRIKNAYGGVRYTASGVAANPTKLTWRSGRLARSLMNQPNGPTPSEGIREVISKQDEWIGRTGSRVPYAAIHETGGFIAATVDTTTRQSGGRRTPSGAIVSGSPRAGGQSYRMERYFWAQFYQSRDEKFKRMALSVRKNGGINMPARPYLSATMTDASTPGILADILAAEVNGALSEALK